MRKISLILLFVLLSLFDCKAQFTNTLSNRQQNDFGVDSTEVQGPTFKFKTYFTALAHKDTLMITRMWSGSLVLPGYSQIYNKQYWKVPVIYAAAGSAIYAGLKFNSKYHETENEKYANYRTLCYVGAGMVYLGQMLDGVLCYKSTQRYLPPRASLLSSLVPGLGQIYNGDYWKLPIFYGGLATCAYLLNFNNMQYRRYQKMYNRATSPDETYTGWMSADNIKWYRDTYRRYRDYTILATVAVYVLNIIDANVFAYFQDFDVSDDLSINIQPNFIEPIVPAFTQQGSNTGYGLQLQFRF